MFRLTLKNVWAHKVRFLLTGVAVVLGVAFVAGSFVFTDTLTKVFDDIFSRANANVDVVVRSSQTVDTAFGQQRAPVSATVLPQVRAVVGERNAAGDVRVFPRIIGRDGKPVGAGQNGPPTLGYSWIEIPELNPNRVVRGSAPAGPDDVAIDETTVKKAGFRVGETVTILTPNSKQYRLVGVTEFAGGTSLAGANLVYFTTAEAQRIAQLGDQYNDILVTQGGVNSGAQRQLQTKVNDALKADGVQGVEVVTGDTFRKEQQDTFQQFIDAFRIALLVFAGISLFVGVFIIYNTFSIVLAQRLRELALMRAIGAGGGQVTGSVLGESLLVGLVASGVGVVAGLGLTVLLRGLLNAIGAKLPAGGLVIEPRTIVVAMAVGIVVTVIASIGPAIRAARTPPVVAMSEVPSGASARPVVRAVAGLLVTVGGFVMLAVGLFVKIDNAVYLVGFGAAVVVIGVFLLAPLIAKPVSRVLGAPVGKLRGISGQLAKENAMRNPRRTATTSVALMVGVALVALITIFAASLNATVEQVVRESFRADFVVSSDSITGMSPDLAKQIQAVPGVEANGVAPLRIGTRNYVQEADGKRKAVLLVASYPDALSKTFNLGDDGAVARLKGNEIAITKRTATSKNLTIGSTLQIVFTDQGQNAQPITYTVAALLRDDALGPRAQYLVPIDSAFGQYVRPIADFQIYVKAAPGANEAAVKRQIVEITKADPSAKVQDQTQFRAAREAEVSQFINIIYALLALALIIAFIGIANTLALSIFERTREIGLLRAVGMTRRQIRTTIRWESVIISVFGTLLGVTLGLIFGWGLVRALKDDGITAFAVPVGRLLAIVIGASLLSVVAAALPARRAAKMNVLQSISYE